MVAATSHLFARWDDGHEKFNIEATNKGLTVETDEFYKTWPHKMTPAMERDYLKSMTPAEELATFLDSRGDCLQANNRLPEAEIAMAECIGSIRVSPDIWINWPDSSRTSCRF